VERELRLKGQVTPEEVHRSPYLYLPAPVPPGTSRLQVSYEYADPVTALFGQGPGNVVDIGIFDPRGRDFIDAAGFRGRPERGEVVWAMTNPIWLKEL
jgi:hypothetical protein